MKDKVDLLITILDREAVSYQVRRFDKPAHHANQAAGLVNCSLGAVVKSLVLTSAESDSFLLVLVSGKNKLDFDQISKLVGCIVQMAGPIDVFGLTGFEVGAVPPFGVEGHYSTFIDEELMSYEYVWAAAGSQKILIRLTPADLRQICNGQVVKIN